MMRAAVTAHRIASLLSCRVQIENFIYPPYDIPLVEAYGGRFESAFVVLHPFVRMPQSLAWSATRRYPDDALITTNGTKCTWTEVIAQTGLANCARLNQALLTAIGSLDQHLADPHSRDALQSFLEAQPVWMPVEGSFPPLLRHDFLRAFTTAGATELIHVPEFPQSDPPMNLSLESLRSGGLPFPASGTLLSPDASFLFTVDWDSFFTLFYGSRAFVSDVAASLDLEGFFATPTTEHAWFNYSMGCATVTLSPEHWQTVESGIR
jgi:hypothetical protein